MRLLWWRKPQPKPDEIEVDDLAYIEDPWAGSPFNADVIRPGDPGWEMFEEAMRTGKPVTGGYDAAGNVWIDRDADSGIGNE